MGLNLNSKFARYAMIGVCVVLLIVLYSQRRTRLWIEEAKQLPFFNTQVSDVKDGTYIGKTDTSFCHVQLEITVADKKITDIKILENSGTKGKGAEGIVTQMIEQNKTVVPAIRGEELASLVFISCADKALRQGTESFLQETDGGFSEN